MKGTYNFYNQVQFLLQNTGFLFLFITGYFLQAQNLNKEQILPNIIFYISDDLSALDISLYNEKGIKVKNIEKLASEGITFTSAFVASPSCAPSRAALLTGLYPARNGAMVNHSYPGKKVIKLPNILRKIGYEVISFGKVGHGFDRQQAQDYGFDYFNKESVNLPEQVSNFFTNRTSTKPVCLLLGDRRPHVPWIKESNYPLDSISLPPFFINTPETRSHWARYATDIQGMDADLGEILALTKKMFGDDYIFLFSADHGSQWPFGKWNLYDYGVHVPLVVSWPRNIKPAERTNALVSWVDIFPTLIDLAGGTIPESLDGKSALPVLKNPGVKHRDYIYSTHSGDGQFNVYPIRSIRTNHYKYIHNLFPANYHTNHSDILRKEGAGAYWNSWEEKAKTNVSAKETIAKYHVRPEIELFDLQNDPTEQHNLAGTPIFHEIKENLKKTLSTMNLQQGDTLPLIGTPYPKINKLPTRKTID